MLTISRTLPPLQVHHTNTTQYHTVTYRTQRGQWYVNMGQLLPPRNLLTSAQNNPSYHNETKRTHPPTTEPPSPYTHILVGLNIYTYLPPTAALQHPIHTHNDTTHANHATHDTTSPPPETKDIYSRIRTYEKMRVISLTQSPDTQHHSRQAST